MQKLKEKAKPKIPDSDWCKLIWNYIKPIYLVHVASLKYRQDLPCYKPRYLPYQLPPCFLEYKLGKSREVSLNLTTNFFFLN